MIRYNNMGESERKTKHVITVKVTAVDTASGIINAEHTLPNGKLKTESLYCTYADEISVGSYLDIMPVLNGNTVGMQTLGFTLPKFLFDKAVESGVTRT